jgi:transposase-like protein
MSVAHQPLATVLGQLVGMTAEQGCNLGLDSLRQQRSRVVAQNLGQRILNKLPKSQQSKAKRALQEIWMTETKKDALAALNAFIETWGVKYDKAAECWIKDREALLAFYDFPAEHWKHLRTTNVIKSSFATVRYRTVRSKGCLSNKTALAMIFKLAEAAEKSWRRLDGHNQLPKVVLGVRFTDGIEAVRSQAQAAAA